MSLDLIVGSKRTYKLIEGSPPPKLLLDSSIPTLSDICDDKNLLSSAFRGDIGVYLLFSSVQSEVNKELAALIGSENYHVEEMSRCIDDNKDMFTQLVVTTLKKVFYKDKNSEWVAKVANAYIEYVVNNAIQHHIGLAADLFVMTHMKPFIHRNFCMMGDNFRTNNLTTGSMYNMLYTFLGGTKRSSSIVSKLGADVVAIIFDHLNIRSNPDMPWMPFSKRLRHC